MSSLMGAVCCCCGVRGIALAADDDDVDKTTTKEQKRRRRKKQNTTMQSIPTSTTAAVDERNGGVGVSSRQPHHACIIDENNDYDGGGKVQSTTIGDSGSDANVQDPIGVGGLPNQIRDHLLLYYLNLRERTSVERVSRHWHAMMNAANQQETRPVWIYLIFRKNHCSGHEKMTVNISFDGPIFWNRQVAYIYCCSCHFYEHEQPLLALFAKFRHRVERVCIVDKPVDYAFLPDSFISYMAEHFPRLQFIYLREMNLEKINRASIVLLAEHANLKKVIVHGCRNYEVFEDFHQLPQLLVVRGEIVGLKAMLGDLFDEAAVDDDDDDDRVPPRITESSTSEVMRMSGPMSTSAIESMTTISTGSIPIDSPPPTLPLSSLVIIDDDDGHQQNGCSVNCDDDEHLENSAHLKEI